MIDMSLLDKKYRGAQIAWAIVDVLEEYIEGKVDKPARVTLDEIRREIIDCEFEPGLPELHRILAERDRDFVPYVFELVKGNLELDGFTFKQIDASTWMVERCNPPE